MDLNPYIDELRRQLVVAAEAGGEPARELAERLTQSLESATRLVLLDALSAAANEVTRDLAPGSVEVRLRGRDPEFVVTSPPVHPPVEGASETRPQPLPAGDAEEGGTARITLRLPEQLKVRVEEAAGAEGLSVNAWLVRAVAGAPKLSGRDARSPRPGPSGGQRLTGWAR